jgi:hypothetical protein
MSENSLLFWVFMFFVLFYIYFDMRINNMKKELLVHYNIFEELLQQGIIQRKRNGSLKIKSKGRPKEEFKVMNPNFIKTPDFVNSFTPTEKETQNGIENIKQIKGIDWFNGLGGNNYATVDFGV